MGRVYLAEQSGPVRRQVALKLLEPGMESRQVVARFESERQSLAVMEPPGIARVFDAGATPTGLPYFVMEHVDGVPITEFCDGRRLAPRERGRRFVQVCRAVQHVHQKGVIHRDLKPSNVLVTAADGEPLCKVIDFGIARAIERSGADALLLPRVDQPVGTPAYLSPEQAQASGLDVDTRTDLRSLGVLPFEPGAYRGYAFPAHQLSAEPPTPASRFAALDREERARIAALRGVDPASLQRELLEDLLLRDSTNVGWRRELAMPRTAQARVLLARGRPGAAPRAAGHGGELLAGTEPTVAAAHVENRIVHAQALRGLGREPEARELFQRAMREAEPLTERRTRSDVRPLLVEAYLGLGRTVDARRLLRATGSRE